MTAELLTPDDAVLQLWRHPEGVFEMRMNRPHARNALNSELRKALFDGYRRFEDEDEWKVALLTASGTVFCAGGDLKEMADNALTIPGRHFSPELGVNIEVAKPVITVINGPALAGGFLMAQNGDLCIAGESGTFGITEVKVGRGAPWAVPLFPMVPQRIMAELLLTGENLSAARAYDVGLVNRVVPDADLLDTAVAMATTIARNAPLSVRAGKATMRLCAEYTRGEAIEKCFELWDAVYLSEDAQEGPAAFRDKRRPVWKGR